MLQNVIDVAVMLNALRALRMKPHEPAAPVAVAGPDKLEIVLEGTA
ncbi:hypothetical protein [Hoeflea sp. BAL378]|nr:hypothetical protein [Hoeflea sp. BAL378]